MHELSVVMSIVDIATDQTRKAGAAEVEDIELVIGALSGIEMSSFDFAWRQGIKHSVLANARLHISRPGGAGRCMDCDTEFVMQRLFDPCTVCGSHLVAVTGGKEMKVKALVVK